MRVLATVRDERIEQELERILDVDAWLRWLAVNSWLANMDSYPGTVDNLYLYRDSRGRFQPIPWDLNTAFGNYHGPTCSYSTDEMCRLDPLRPECGPGRPLVERVLQVEPLRVRYMHWLAELVEGPLRPDDVLEEMEGLRHLIERYALRDSLKEFSNDDFADSFVHDVPEGDNPVRVPGLEPFIRERDRVMRQTCGLLR